MIHGSRPSLGDGLAAPVDRAGDAAATCVPMRPGRSRATGQRVLRSGQADLGRVEHDRDLAFRRTARAMP